VFVYVVVCVHIVVSCLYTLFYLLSSRCIIADKVRESGGCVLVHCLAGISRSPTLAIAYVMRLMGMSNDDAYK
jgi:protein-tyrosine phosphatase